MSTAVITPEQENIELKNIIEGLEATIKDYEEKVEIRDEEIDLLCQRIRLLQGKAFGHKSESLSALVAQEQMSLFVVEDDPLEEEEEELIPSIIILSSGELTPFTLDFYYADDSDEEILSTVSADETGRVWLAHEEDEDEEDR